MTGLYIHIPFCQHKCFYCDFLSMQKEKHFVDQYLKALLKEMDFYSNTIAENRSFDTVFIGGGTPSILELEELELLISAIKAKFSINKEAEITIECNPESLSYEKIVGLKKAGVNRFSLGIQSFDDDLLKGIGRIHDSQRALEAVADLKKAGVENFNMDFIYGLPGQSLAQWEETLKLAVKLRPTHLSLYNLMVSEGTVFAQLERENKLILPSEEEQLEMLKMGVLILSKSGYDHYEIANFALKGFECKHNLIYWHNLEYLGLGLGGFSYWLKERRGNARNLTQYIDSWLNKGEPIFFEREMITPQQEEVETIIMALRLKEGINYDTMASRFNLNFPQKYAEAIDWAITSGLGEQLDGKIFRLTEKGIPVSNQVMLKFLP